MTPSELAGYLKEVPPTQLSLIALAWELVGPDGAVDHSQVQLHMQEVLIAKNEATAYIQGNYVLLEALKKCLKPDH